MVGAVLAMEWVPQECRFLCEVFVLLFWTTGVVLVTPIAYLMRDNTWRDFQLVLTLCSSYSLIQYWYIVIHLQSIIIFLSEISLSLSSLFM